MSPDQVRHFVDRFVFATKAGKADDLLYHIDSLYRQISNLLAGESVLSRNYRIWKSVLDYLCRAAHFYHTGSFEIPVEG